MIGIKAVGACLAAGRIDNLAQAEGLGESSDFVVRKIGAKTLPRLAEGQESSDLAASAVKDLVMAHGLELDMIEALIVVTQNGDGSGLPHTSALLSAKLGLPSQVAAFDISLGCSGYVYGLSVLEALMLRLGLINAVLVTADPYSKIVDPGDRNTALLFGDAATATWLSSDGGWHMGKPILETDGRGGDHLMVKEGKLTMNGRQVFNFAAKQVPEQINKCLEVNHLKPNMIDCYCLHQGSLSIVEAISRRFPEVKDRFVSDIWHTGNTVSSSIPLLLKERLLDSRLNRILISGFGVGLSWGTNIIHKES